MTSADVKEVDNSNKVPALTVYRKKSTFKGATEKDFWYSATLSKDASLKLSNGTDEKISVICKFSTNVQVPDLMAFEISNVIGTVKHKPLKDDDGNIVYNNYNYYITSCDCNEIKGEPLPL